MAVAFEVEGTRTSEYLFLPENLEVHPELNGRHDIPDIQSLIDSILEHGQLQPVTIRRTAGMPVLVAGFSRWRAVSEINKQKLTQKPLALRCSYTQLTEKQAFLANIEENRVRNATTPMDDAYNLQRLVNVYQLTEQECADAYRCSVSWIKGRLALLEASPEAEKAIRSGRVKGPAVKAIAKLKKEQAAKLPAEGKITAADIARVSDESQKPKVQKAANTDKLLSLADAMYQAIADMYADEVDLPEAAKVYWKARNR